MSFLLSKAPPPGSSRLDTSFPRAAPPAASRSIECRRNRPCLPRKTIPKQLETRPFAAVSEPKRPQNDLKRGAFHHPARGRAEGDVAHHLRATSRAARRLRLPLRLAKSHHKQMKTARKSIEVPSSVMEMVLKGTAPAARASPQPSSPPPSPSPRRPSPRPSPWPPAAPPPSWQP